MATPADQRLLELCDKWLKSLELHIRYSGLDTESYWKVQPWPEHQRPSRWIIDLAVQKAVALRSQVQERIKQGDTKFSDSLELMTFLANLIGSEHIERFIPLADPENEVDLKAPAPEDAASDGTTGTRQMPELASGAPPTARKRHPLPGRRHRRTRRAPRRHARRAAHAPPVRVLAPAARAEPQPRRTVATAGSRLRPAQPPGPGERDRDAGNAGVRTAQTACAAGRHLARRARRAQIGSDEARPSALGQATW